MPFLWAPGILLMLVSLVLAFANMGKFLDDDADFNVLMKKHFRLMIPGTIGIVMFAIGVLLYFEP